MSCLSEIRGQESAKRAIEIALAGGHSLLLIGPEGCGKTMLIDAARAIDSAARISEARPHEGDSALACQMVVECPPVSEADMRLLPPSEPSAVIADRIAALGKTPTEIDAPARRLLDDAKRHGIVEAEETTAIAVACTIARLDGCEVARRIHIAEALAYAPALSGILERAA